MCIYWTTLFRAIERFSNKGGFVRASHVALSFMLAIFPFCIFVLSLAGAFSGETQVDDMVDFVLGTWPEAIAGPIASELRSVLTAGGGTITVGAILSVVFASNGVDAIRLVITSAYRDHDPRPFWKTRLLSIGFVLGGTLLFVCASVLGVLIPLIMHFFEDLVPWLDQSILSNGKFRELLTIGILLFAVYACHKWLPGVKHDTRSLAPGILLTLVLWYTASKGISFYFSTFSTYSVTYAGLAGVMSALVYMYMMAAIFVLGAEYNGSIMKQEKEAQPQS